MLLIDKINKNSEVIKHSGAIHVTNSLTLLDRKVINVLLKNAFDDLGKKIFHEIRISDLRKIIGWKGNSDQEIKKCLTKLTTTALQGNIFGKDKKNEEGWMVVSLLGSANYFKKAGYCIYEYPEALVRMFKEPNIYAKLDLKVQKNFRSKHSIALWEYFMEILSVGKRDVVRTSEMCLEDFKKLLDLEFNKYQKFNILNQKIIKPSIKEINKVSNIEVKLEMIKEGRRVSALVFVVSKKKSVEKNSENKYENDIKEAEIINEATDEIEEKNPISEKPIFRTLTKDFLLSAVVAYELIKTYPEEQIKANLEYIKNHAKENQIRNYAAFTVKAIKHNYQIQESPAELEQKKRMEELRKAMEGEKKKEEGRQKKIKEEMKKLSVSKWWKNVEANLQEEYGKEIYQQWLKDVKPLTSEESPKELVLCLPSKFLRDWVRKEFLENNSLSKNKKTLSDVILNIEAKDVNREYERVIVIFLKFNDV